MSTAPGGEIRAVLDTNVLVSAFTRPRGLVAPLWRAVQARRYRLLISPALIHETARVLRKDFQWEERRIIRRSKRLESVQEVLELK